MKKILFILNICFVMGLSHAQAPTNSENYIYSKTYLSEDGSKTAEAIQYFDGLGRPKQSVAIKATPTGKDLVTPVYYDDLGRQPKDFLPVPMSTTNGGIQSINEAGINGYYGVANAYSEKIFESSPLSRVTEVTSPGEAWGKNAGHTRQMKYEIAMTADMVKRYSATTSWSNATAYSSLPVVGWYGDRQLIKNTSIDENGNRSIEFKNTLGQLILVRKINQGNFLDTYYIYNEFGQQVLVIPPKANDQISQNGNIVTQSVLDKLCYQYRFDNKNRLVEKRIPGKRFWEYFVYDKQNRLVLSQDANQNAKQWTFTKYDLFDRIVYTGLFANTATRISMQNALNNMAANAMNNESRSDNAPFQANGITVYYTKNAFPTGSMTINSVNYYDSYPADAPAKPSAVQGEPIMNTAATLYSVNGIDSYRSTKGMPTSSFVKNTDSNSWMKSYIWYDSQARPVGSHSINYLGGYTKTESVLDFAGVMKLSYTYHKRTTASAETIVKQRSEYDGQNRLKKLYHQVNANPEVLLTENTYNDLGQLTNKKVGDNLQSIDYTYNIRGWVTQINDLNNMGSKLFAYKIKYDQREGAQYPNNTYSSLQVTPQYNGNIAEVDWKTGGSTSDGKMRRYGFVYDELNRLKAGFFQDQNNPYTKEYSEYLEYDQNGNITKLNRTGKMAGTTPEVMDNLVYNYAGNDNQLTSLTETGAGNALSGYPLAMGTGATIGYDDNGNMTSQMDKGISSIQYNFLNLPVAVVTNNNQNAQYFYRADGTKVKKVAAGKTVDYLDGFQYTDGVLQFFMTAEGYYDAAASRYVYNYTDHLGNIRVSYTKGSNGAAVVLEENNYYPFGLKHGGYNTGSTANANYAYGYNGKELQENGTADYGARMYMADIARWGVVDPLAESYRRWSPYNYAVNNPVRFIDPDGRGTQLSWAQQQTGWETFEQWEERNGGSFESSFNSIVSDGSTGGSINMSDATGILLDLLNALQGSPDPITTLNYVFMFGEWDYIYTEKQGMMKGTKGAEFFSEFLMDNDPYSAKYFNSKPDRKVNNTISELNISITIVKLKNGEYNIATNKKQISYDSSAYDANSKGYADIQYYGNGNGLLNIQFQISNKEQALKGKIKEQDFSVNVKNSHTAFMTVSYPFSVVENKGKTSLQFGHAINYQSYNLNALKIAEGIWEIPLIPKQFNGVPINPVDYNYQLKKK